MGPWHRILQLPILLKEIVGYGMVSVIAFAADVGLLALLAATTTWHYLTAASLSFIVGGVVAYCLSVTFVFRVRRLQNSKLELPAFVALGFAGLLINAMAIYAVMETTAAPLLLAKLFAASLTFAANFTLRRTLLFSRPAMHHD